MKTVVLEPLPEYFWEKVDQQKLRSDFCSPKDSSARKAQIAIIRTKTIFSKSLFDLYPNVNFIIRAGTGFDNIDITEAKKRNILVANTPEANANSAYEHTISLFVAMLKNLQKAKNEVLTKTWKKSLESNYEFSDIKALVVGYGRVGKKVSQTLQFLGAKILVVDPYIDKKEWANNYLKPISYSEGLSWCNLLTFHCPLTKETYHYFNDDVLEKIKHPFFLINTARGKITSLETVEKGLENNQIKGVGLDVFPEEPATIKPWMNNHNVFLSPHVGAHTESAKKRMSEELFNVWHTYYTDQRAISLVDDRFYYDRFHSS